MTKDGDGVSLETAEYPGIWRFFFVDFVFFACFGLIVAPFPDSE